MAALPGSGISARTQKSRITLVAAAANFFLAVIKLVAGFLGNSAALVADGLHSFSDLASDVLVYFTVQLGSQQADASHPYGHGRFETLATVVFGAMLLLVALGIGWDALGRLLHQAPLTVPGYLSLWVALLSVLVNELLFQYTAAVGRRTRSRLLLANAWHHRSDAISSLLVIAGVLASMAGWPQGDALAALLVSFMVAHIAVRLVLDSSRELVDTGLPAEQVTAIRHAILAMEGVTGVHMLRSRLMNGEGMIDVHVMVSPRISVSEGHMIGLSVRHQLVRQFDQISDALIHVDCEDDRRHPAALQLPLRSFLEAELREHWRSLPISSRIERLSLHYVRGKIEIEIYLPWQLMQEPGLAGQVSELRCAAALRDLVSEVRVYYTDASVDDAGV